MSLRRVVVGVTGGIAAFKSLELIRLLVDAGCEVEPVVTRAALEFVGAASVAAVAGRPVRVDLFDDLDPSPHTSLAHWADAVVIYPATADVLAKLAHGSGDDLLSTLVLAFDGPIVVAPAMHTQMWRSPAVQRNAEQLRADGYHLLGPDTGRLAGGDVGEGRLIDAGWVVHALGYWCGDSPVDLSGYRILVSAGGTREPIDPVRFVGNHSSGRQGCAIAQIAAIAGAEVALVTTVRPTFIGGPVTITRVSSALELQGELQARQEWADVVVMAAAVADYRVASPSKGKIKREGRADLTLEMVANPDIVAGLASHRPREQVIVAFAAEVGDLRQAVLGKLAAKKVDIVVGNDVSAQGSGFGSATNEVVIADRRGGWVEVPLASKEIVAAHILSAALALGA
ncbi:MAG: bifunctional phosphopantothenoylcysteine decarboxylase/phosphopantothenate--cysteine ligase CoaBC [Ferrimicrobium sp.]